MLRLIHGADSFRSFKKAQEIFKAAQKKIKDAEVFNIDVSEKTPEGIFQLLEGQSLFSTKKIILLKNLTENRAYKEIIDALLNRLKKLDKSTILIFWESKKVPANTKFGKFFKSKKLEDVFDIAKKK